MISVRAQDSQQTKTYNSRLQQDSESPHHPIQACLLLLLHQFWLAKLCQIVNPFLGRLHGRRTRCLLFSRMGAISSIDTLEGVSAKTEGSGALLRVQEQIRIPDT